MDAKRVLRVEKEKEREIEREREKKKKKKKKKKIVVEGVDPSLLSLYVCAFASLKEEGKEYITNLADGV